jgi:hypothetical protein
MGGYNNFFICYAGQPILQLALNPNSKWLKECPTPNGSWSLILFVL